MAKEAEPKADPKESFGTKFRNAMKEAKKDARDVASEACVHFREVECLCNDDTEIKFSAMEKVAKVLGFKAVLSFEKA